jgi:hypothetical protein
VVIAKDVAELHGENNLTKQTALNEKGDVVNGFGNNPNLHDILTGTQPDGTAFGPESDKTCGNWTKDGVEGSAIVGHSDRIGLNDSAPMKSWNSSHPSRGCSQPGLVSTGGVGLFYCFATNWRGARARSCEEHHAKSAIADFEQKRRRQSRGRTREWIASLRSQ